MKTRVVAATAKEVYPRCLVLGSQRPVVRKSRTAALILPEKCIGCRLFKEGCRRDEKSGRQQYGTKSLDWGFCGISGIEGLTTVQVDVRDHLIEFVVPSKCAGCDCMYYDYFSGLRCNRFSDNSGSGVPLDWSEIPDSDVQALYEREERLNLQPRPFVNAKIGSKRDAAPAIRQIGPYVGGD